MIPSKTHAILLVTILAGGALAGCTGSGDTSDTGAAPGGDAPVTGSIDITGSSTVYPAGQAWAEEFQLMHRDVRIAYNVLGTGGGFTAFCRGEAHMTGASRPIKDSETQACRANGIEPIQVQIGIDGLAVVVSQENTFAQDITTEELHRIWTADASKQADRWNELRPEWPDQPIERYGPGTDSGTYDYWVEAIIHPHDGDEATTRSDYTPNEDDNLLVQGIASSPYAIGYFGLAYVHENGNVIRAVAVDGGSGPVEPTAENVASGTYAPLARPLFYYTPGQPTGALQAFLQFGLSDDGQALLEEVGYIGLPAALLEESRAKVNGA